MVKMGGIEDQYLTQEQAEFPRTSHGFRPKALQKIALPEQEPPTAAKANNMGLGLNNFLEYKDSDYKKVQTSVPGKRRRHIVTNSIGLQPGSQYTESKAAAESQKTNTFDVLSHNIQSSKYVTERDRENDRDKARKHKTQVVI